MTPGAFIMESGAHALGCTVFPAGTGQTEQQLQAMAELRPVAYMGTPSFLRILVEKAPESRHRHRSLKKGWSAARPFRPACATGSPSAAWTSTRAMPRPTWA
jgi:phenylacetate-CoA ligase